MFDYVQSTVFRYIFNAIINVMPPSTPIVLEGLGSSKQLCELIGQKVSKKILILFAQ